MYSGSQPVRKPQSKLQIKNKNKQTKTSVLSVVVTDLHYVVGGEYYERQQDVECNCQ